jgi:hypothetical protein
MVRLVLLLGLADLALVAVALIDCLSTEKPVIRGLPRALWAVVIVFFSPIGPIAWFLSGRPEHERVPGRERWLAANGLAERARRRPVAPDDDPDFLGKLARTRHDDDELLRRYEEDLRRPDGDDPDI